MGGESRNIFGLILGLGCVSELAFGLELELRCGNWLGFWFFLCGYISRRN